MAAISENSGISDEVARELWKKILGEFPEDQEVCIIDFKWLDKLRVNRVIVDLSVSTMIEFLIKPFADMTCNKYQVYLYEARQFVANVEKINHEMLLSIGQVSQMILQKKAELEALEKAKEKRLNRLGYGEIFQKLTSESEK